MRALVGAAWAHSLEFMYGAPEYGANRNLAGWTYTGWGGDAQPMGFSDAEVSGPGDARLCHAGLAARALVEGFLGALSPRAAGASSPWAACGQADKG